MCPLEAIESDPFFCPPRLHPPRLRCRCFPLLFFPQIVLQSSLHPAGRLCPPVLMFSYARAPAQAIINKLFQKCSAPFFPPPLAPTPQKISYFPRREFPSKRPFSLLSPSGVFFLFLLKYAWSHDPLLDLRNNLFVCFPSLRAAEPERFFFWIGSLRTTSDEICRMAFFRSFPPFFFLAI